jgi:integrating conjugative element protein (TIGR03756 family)
MIKNTFRILALLLIVVVPKLTSAQPHITTATILRATTQALPHCLHYKIKGTCYWWVKDGLLGHPEATLKVAHYIPDVVVSVFDRAGDNPWLEAKIFYDKPAVLLARKLIQTMHGLVLGGGRHSFNTPHETNVYFKEVTIIGNPAAQLLGKDITISTNAIPFVPYFNSLLDVIGWRFGLEMLYPAAWQPYAHPIGQKGYAWGHVYPREGFIVAANDAEAAAIAAQRAADIITKRYQPHSYHRLKNRCGQHCGASPVHENDPHTQWQALFPQESHRCGVFGSPRDFGDKLATRTQGRYVWILWRYYEGCIPAKGGAYMGETRF